jgi:hypothetical protein
MPFQKTMVDPWWWNYQIWGFKLSSNGYFHDWSCEEDNGVFIILLFNGSIHNMKIQSTLGEQGYHIFLNNISN